MGILRPTLHGTSRWVPRWNCRLSRHGRVARQRLAHRCCRRLSFPRTTCSQWVPVRGFNNHGIRAPEDVSIIGFDDLSLGAFSNPPLTTVHVPKHEVGEIAVRRLVGNIRNPKSYTCKTAVSTSFVRAPERARNLGGDGIAPARAKLARAVNIVPFRRGYPSG